MSRRGAVIVGLTLVMAMPGGCQPRQKVDKSKAQTSKADRPERPGVISSEKVNRVTLASGLVIEDLKLGEGEVCLPGAVVRVTYTGLVRGAPGAFDSSGVSWREIDLRGNLIRGWTEGIPGMRVGGTRRLTIPPELGYGTREVRDSEGKVVVPAGSTLVYVVDLVGVGDR